jgi:hypothetical protein
MFWLAMTAPLSWLTSALLNGLQQVCETYYWRKDSFLITAVCSIGSTNLASR